VFTSFVLASILQVICLQFPCQFMDASPRGNALRTRGGGCSLLELQFGIFYSSNVIRNISRPVKQCLSNLCVSTFDKPVSRALPSQSNKKHEQSKLAKKFDRLDPKPPTRRCPCGQAHGRKSGFNNVITNGVPNHPRHRVAVKFLHQVGTMRFCRLDANVQHSGNLSTGVSFHQ
jgi:hypothetical protein